METIENAASNEVLELAVKIEALTSLTEKDMSNIKKRLKDQMRLVRQADDVDSSFKVQDKRKKTSTPVKTLNLEEKLKILDKIKKLEVDLRKMRVNIFHAQDYFEDLSNDPKRLKELMEKGIGEGQIPEYITCYNTAYRQLKKLLS